MEALRSENAAPKRPTTRTTSCPGATVSFSARHASLVIRFSRFLRTAPPQPLPTTTAILLTGVPFALYSSRRPLASTFLPSANRPLMSLPLRSLSFLERLLLI